MTHDAAFLQAVLDEPDKDAPRLAYADWLEKHGDPRGEFIRVQCALARIATGDPQRGELEAREQELLTEHESEWAEPLPDFVERWEFRRGFVGGLVASASRFLRHADALAGLPLVRHAWLWGATARLAPALAASPALRRLTSLDLSGNKYGDALAQALAASPHAAGLTALQLVRTRLSDAGLTALASSPHLARLRALDLDENRIGDPGLKALGQSPRLRRLRVLKLAANQKLRVSGIRALGGLAALTALDLSDNFVRDTGAAVLAASPALARLESLNLSAGRLGNRGVVALVASPHLRRLLVLNLSANDIGAAGAAALAASARLGRLRALDLQDCSLGSGAQPQGGGRRSGAAGALRRPSSPLSGPHCLLPSCALSP